MNPQQQPTSDPNTWPIVDCESGDVFLGEFVHDCTPQLTDEQKTWPLVECVPTDVFVEPALVLELTVRGDADQGDVALAMAEFLAAVSAREESLGGTGLLFDKRQSRHEKGRVRVVLYPRREPGSRQRLRDLAAWIEGSGSPVVPATVLGERGSFVGCHAIAAA
ncbi:unnamed protein product [Gemmataceae bacterium]|nr:unnamed protein product [Gemmataceae bacterium]VTT97389.1 unnamed protein product [Gemmataceae bacterium]